MLESSSQPAKSTNGLIRLSGAMVLLGLGIHFVVNGFVKQFPPVDPSPAELQAYLSAEASTWALVHGLKYLALVSLVLFAAGVHARTSGRGATLAAGWGVMGLLGTAVHVTNAMIANGIEIMAFYDFTRLSEEANLFWLLFYTVRVLFTGEIVAWGMVIFGFSMAGYQTATLPRWITILGFFGSAMCMLSGVYVVSVLKEGWATLPMEIAGMSGLLWFASVGVYMLMRGDT